MIRYGQLGADKKLRDIVFAGSHDAGITSGGKNEKTQSLDILGQANAGVRIFDLRIMAGTVGSGHNKSAALMAYHGEGKESQTQSRFMVGSGKKTTIERSKLSYGVWGLGLDGMLKDAATFVGNNKSEFLIFKFDKCTNWNLIAENCVRVLGTNLYSAGGDLNRKTLTELGGKVIAVFSESGLTEVDPQYKAAGILGWRNLNAKDGPTKPYDPKFNGLQYYGKGGTALGKGATKGYEGKMGLNIKKQGKLMGQLASESGTMNHSSNVLGMMYWTSTGIFESIKSRNDYMWNSSGVGKFKSLWTGGLKESIETRTKAQRIKKTKYSSGVQMKAFMPNIVMIDFSDTVKCKVIYELNTLAGTMLTKMFQNDADSESDDI